MTETSADKIKAAVAAGNLDEATGILYRVFAIYGDPRLPEALRGEPEEDLAALVAARDGLAQFPAEVQLQLTPYLVRPADPGSAWNTEPAAAAGGSDIVLAVARPPTDDLPVPRFAPACDGPWMHEQVSPNIPVMIWAQCTGDPLAAASLFEEVRGYMAGLWQPMTNLMGEPIGDRNIPNDGWGDTPETGDGLIDIYLLSGFSPSGHPRDFGYGTALAMAPETPPFEGQPGARRSSAYVVVAPGLTGAQLESTLAHEFFHVLEYRHNNRGTLDCPVRQLASGCSTGDHDFHWFLEASAKWSEEYFVPRGRPEMVYPWFANFGVTGVGLADTVANNEYASFPWPLFMQQESSATKVADAWKAMESKKGWRQIQAALDAQLSFKDHFRDFAVRVLNKELLPGNPITPRFRSATLDPTFPTTPPSGYRFEATVLEDLLDGPMGTSRTYDFRSTLDFMWSMYLPFEPPPGAQKLTLDFVTFSPEIDVDAIVRVRNSGWERRKLLPGETIWCLEKPADAIEEGFLVFSNHDQNPNVIARDWTIKAEATGCGAPVGTLTYSYLDSNPPGGWSGSSMAEDATVQVKLKRAPDDSPFAAMYLNDGSTYGAHTFAHAVSPPDVEGCSAIADSTGSPGGALEIDSVVGNVSLDDAGNSVLSLGISLPIHLEIDEDWCRLGSGTSSRETTLQFPQCDGKENPDVATASTQTFVFNCDFQGSSAAWSVSGILVINR